MAINIPFYSKAADGSWTPQTWPVVAGMPGPVGPTGPRGSVWFIGSPLAPDGSSKGAWYWQLNQTAPIINELFQSTDGINWTDMGKVFGFGITLPDPKTATEGAWFIMTAGGINNFGVYKLTNGAWVLQNEEYTPTWQGPDAPVPMVLPLTPMNLDCYLQEYVSDVWQYDGTKWIDKGNIKGATGATGATGAPGTAATIKVGTVTTLGPNQPATVTNEGTETAAVFDFGIPRGVTPTVTVDPVVKDLPWGTTPTVTNTGSDTDVILSFGLEQGKPGRSLAKIVVSETPIVAGQPATVTMKCQDAEGDDMADAAFATSVGEDA